MDNQLFHISKDEIDLINKWKDALPPIEADVFGETYMFMYIFYPTGLGIVKKVRRADGAELDFTNYNNW